MRNEDVFPLLEVAASIMTLWPDRSLCMGIGLQVEFLSHILFDMRNSRTSVFDNVAGPKPWQLRPRTWERRWGPLQVCPTPWQGRNWRSGKISAQLPIIESAVLALPFFQMSHMVNRPLYLTLWQPIQTAPWFHLWFYIPNSLSPWAHRGFQPQSTLATSSLVQFATFEKYQTLRITLCSSQNINISCLIHAQRNREEK